MSIMLFDELTTARVLVVLLLVRDVLCCTLDIVDCFASGILLTWYFRVHLQKVYCILLSMVVVVVLSCALHLSIEVTVFLCCAECLRPSLGRSGRKKRCTCLGCAGGDRKNSPQHEGPCTFDQQNGISYGSYCARCAPNYRCIRCGINAVPDNVVDGVCSVCLVKKTCTCLGCAGGGRKNSSSHVGPCPSERQNSAVYGSYCRRCAPHYLCVRCGINAVPDNVAGGICSVCSDKKKFWCQCPGCGDGLARHVHHTVTGTDVRHCLKMGSKKPGDHYFCITCIRQWACIVCGKQLRCSPALVTAPSGPKCASCEGVSHEGICYHTCQSTLCPCVSSVQMV